MDVAEFYDGFADYQLGYLNGRNRRLATIHRLLGPLIRERQPRSALDIGCGIGVTTSWLAKQIPSVAGVDISPRAISLARTHHPGASFSVCNVPEDPLPDGPHDLIGLFDALEHFAPRHRPRLFERIGEVISENSVLAINVPSRLVALANVNNDSRQIIDEPIGADEIVALASSLGMEPLVLQRYGITTANQYVFCAFAKHYDIASSTGESLLERVENAIMRAVYR